MNDFENQNHPDLSNGGSEQSGAFADQTPQTGYSSGQQQGYPQNSQQGYGQEPPYAAPGQAPYNQGQYAGQQPSYGEAQGQQQYGAQGQYAGQQPPPYGDPNQQYNNGYNGQPIQQTINIQTPPPVYVNQKSKIAAGLLGIFLGSFGVHNFYLGYTGKAVAQLLIALLTCGAGAAITGIWGLIEGIMILTGSISVDGQGIPLSD